MEVMASDEGQMDTTLSRAGQCGEAAGLLCQMGGGAGRALCGAGAEAGRPRRRICIRRCNGLGLGKRTPDGLQAVPTCGVQNSTHVRENES